MRRMIIALAIGILVIASSLCLQAQYATTASAPAQADGEKIKSLVKDLGSDDYKVREKAQKDLTAIGIPAKAEIAEAVKSEDAEVKQRAEQIMVTIVKAEQLIKDDSAKKNHLWGFAIDNGMFERPVVAGNVVLAAGLDGKVYAVDVKTGKQVWVTINVPVAKLKPGEDPTSQPASKPTTKPANPADVAKDEEESEEGQPNAQFIGGARLAIVPISRSGALAPSLSAPVVSDDMFVYSDGKQINCASVKGGKLAWSLLATGLPTIAGGLVFVGSEDGGIDAIDVKTGKLAWRAKDALATFTRPAAGDGFVCLAGMENANAAGAAPAGAAVAPAVRIAAVRRGMTANPVGTHIQSLDSKTGKELWKVPAADCQAVYVAGGLVIWQANNALTALDVKDGKLVWTRDIPVVGSAGMVRVGGAVMRSSPGLTGSDDLSISGDGIYLVSSGEAVALDIKTGKDIWRAKLDFTDTDVAASDTDVVPDPTGRMVNRRIVVQGGQQVQIAMVVGGRTMTIGGAGAPVADDKTVYVAAGNGIHAFGIKTGQRLWHFRTANMPNGKLTLVDGVIYYGSVANQQPSKSSGPDVIGLNAMKTK